MLSLYEDEIGTEKISRIKSTLAAFPYLLRHHIRPKCLDCKASDVPQQFRLKLLQPPFDIVETRHEGDISNGGVVDPDSYEGKPQLCSVDKRSLPKDPFNVRIKLHVKYKVGYG